MSIKNPRNTLEQSRNLRRSMPKGESLFWDRVRNNRFMEYAFLRLNGIKILSSETVKLNVR